MISQVTPTDPASMTDAELLALPATARRIPAYAGRIEAAQRRRAALKSRLERDLKNREALICAAYATRNDRAAEAHHRAAEELRDQLANL